jgi:hypothetical protein
VTKHLAANTIEPKFATPERQSKIDPFAEKLAGWPKPEAAKSREQKRTVKQLHTDLVALGVTSSYARVAAFARISRARKRSGGSFSQRLSRRNAIARFCRARSMIGDSIWCLAIVLGPMAYNGSMQRKSPFTVCRQTVAGQRVRFVMGRLSSNYRPRSDNCRTTWLTQARPLARASMRCSLPGRRVYTPRRGQRAAIESLTAHLAV